MKFLVMIKATADSEAGVPPSAELLSEMMKYNEQHVKAGIMLDGGGLKPSSQGVRVRFEGKSRTVIDGPFTETKELVAGYWLWQVKSREEAIEWIKRCPCPMNATGDVELRPLYDMGDFPAADAETIALHDKLQTQAKLS